MLMGIRNLAVGACLAVAGPAFSADYVQPAPVPVVAAQPEFSGWYLRGDLNYHATKLRGTRYITYGCCDAPEPGTDDFDSTSLRGAWSVGAGVGYQLTRHLRTDLTLDYWSRSKFKGTSTGMCNNIPCASTDEGTYSAWVMLANLYADLGTWHGVTPYVGAGIGGAHVNWSDLRNVDSGLKQGGTSDWRFAWSLMAGASYCLTERAELDAGYRYTNIAGGRMFEFANNVGPGFDSGMHVHEVRAGLRWHLGGSSERCAPQAAMTGYVPIYK